MPMCDCAARAAYAAMAGSTPSRRTSSSATSSGGGMRRRTWRERLRIVTMTSSTLGAHSSHTVRGTGSSSALSSASAARSVRRSASSMTMTRQRPTVGDDCACNARSRASRTWIVRPLVETICTSAWEPSIVVRHSRHSPHPPCGHSSAAANERAALERPEPGGPVMSHACVMRRASPTASLNVRTASC